MRQINLGGSFLLPILYQDCVVPPLVAHRRYADFRTNYEMGLTDLLAVFGRDLKTAASVGKTNVHPWPSIDQSDGTVCYLHSTRFDRFFRMNCVGSWSVDKTIDHIVSTLSLPRNQEVAALGMRWSFTYSLLLGDKRLPLSTTLSDAGVVDGTVLRLNISGTYEDVCERELKSMWTGDKFYEISGALRREAELRAQIAARGTLTAKRLKELADACFTHVDGGLT